VKTDIRVLGDISDQTSKSTSNDAESEGVAAKLKVLYAAIGDRPHLLIVMLELFRYYKWVCGNSRLKRARVGTLRSIILDKWLHSLAPLKENKVLLT
jgi:hypothetical protein